jgi:hypothetical protein
VDLAQRASEIERERDVMVFGNEMCKIVGKGWVRK